MELNSEFNYEVRKRQDIGNISSSASALFNGQGPTIYRLSLKNNATITWVFDDPHLQSTGTKVAGFTSLRKFFADFNHTHAFFMEPHEQCYFDADVLQANNRAVQSGPCKGSTSTTDGEPAGIMLDGFNPTCCKPDRAPTVLEERQQCAIMAEFGVHFGRCNWMHVSTWVGLWAPATNATNLRWAESKKRHRARNRRADGQADATQTHAHANIRPIVNNECPSFAIVANEGPRTFETLPRLMSRQPCSAGAGQHVCGRNFGARQCSPGAITAVALEMWDALFSTNPSGGCDGSAPHGVKHHAHPHAVKVAERQTHGSHRRPAQNAQSSSSTAPGEFPSTSTMFWAFVRGFFGVPKGIPHNLFLEGV